MRRTPPALARRLDRLARRAHAFHRFAHHPLCDAYGGELVRLGRRARLCRGCALAAVGAGVGLVGGAALGHLAPSLLAVATVAGALAAVVAARPRAGAPRSKLATRAAPAALLAFALAHAAREPTLPSAAAAAVASIAGAAAILRYRRRGPDRSACAACPERAGPRTCSGYRPIVRRERAFARIASRWLAR